MSPKPEDDAGPVAVSAGPAPERDEAELVLELGEERLAIAKRRVKAGVVRVTTRTEARDEVAEIDLDRYGVEVTRVPVGRVIDVVPVARSEGDVTIVPVFEERSVIVKQLFLVEELHLRHVVERRTARETVRLRRQRASVERFDAAGRPITRDD